MELVQAINQRKTAKILGNIDQPMKDQIVPRTEIEELLELAKTAPFHFPCHTVHLPNGQETRAPWRIYILDKKKCLELLAWFKSEEINSGKIGQMLATCQYLLQVTWCPEPHDLGFNRFEDNQKNMEHIAGTSAAIENILLGATSKRLANYWSSGGVLREERLYDHLSIPKNQILLGSLFLSPEGMENVQIIGGAHRGKTGDPSNWSKWL